MPNLPDIGEGQLIDYAQDFKSQAMDNAPATVQFSSGGTIIGAVAFGPAGGVVGATVGSSIGYLKDEGYFDSDEEPEVIEAEVGDEDKI